MWACGCGGCARGCAVLFAWLRPVRPHVCPLVRCGRGPHARAVRGRYIDYTKVRALPEWLGQCKLLERLCVPPAAPPPCAFAAVPAHALLRVALPRGGAVRVRSGAGATLRCRSSAAAEPRARMARARGRPARGRGGPEPPGGGRNGGVQGRVLLRARGAAGGGRLAQPQETVSAPDRRVSDGPAECARAWRPCARTRRTRLGPCVCAYVWMQQCVYVHTYVCLHAQNASQRGRAGVCTRDGSGRLLI
jgi:hypothetical protein